MFRATMCPSSGEITVSMWHLVFVTVWMTLRYAGWNPPCITIETLAWRLCNVTSHYTPMDIMFWAQRMILRCPQRFVAFYVRTAWETSPARSTNVLFLKQQNSGNTKSADLRTISISYGVPMGRNVLCCQWGQWFIYGHAHWRH